MTREGGKQEEKNDKNDNKVKIPGYNLQFERLYYSTLLEI